MSLQAIITGVQAATNVAVDVAQTTQALFSALDPAAHASIGRGYKTFDDSFGRLKVINVSDREVVAEIDHLLLQTFSEVYLDRMAPMYTFGSPIMYTAGTDARQFVYSASILVNQSDGDGRAEFNQAYENTLRVSRLVNNATPRYIELTYRDQIRRGYLTSLTTQINSQQPNKIDITFSMFVIAIGSLA